MAGKSVELFISYSHRDEELRQQLDKHLASLKRQKVIEAWHDRKIEAGMEWAKQIDDNLNKADIILLLISPDFIFSNYCSEIEMEQAIKRHEAGEAIVVPIILEPCDWTWLPFSKYQAFPKNAKPITTWTNANEALLDVVQGIRTVVERLFEQRQQELKDKETAQDRYLKKVEEILSFDGEISIPAQDTLDEIREELRLTPEEADELKTRAFAPYKKYKENLQRYEKTFLKIIQHEYPLSDKSKEALKLRQRDLGIKSEDAEQIEKRILTQIKANDQNQVKEEDSQRQRQQEAERNKQLELKKQREKVNSFQKSLEVKNDDIAPIAAQLTPLIKELQQQREVFSNSIEIAQKSQSTTETFTAIDPTFLERCQRELARYIGPVARFIMEDTLAEHPRILPQQLIELLSTEIPNPQNAKQFKENL
ncbi:MAG: TIR domain-containing protein [Nostoc sp.]|uniref:toll/interleukin-1 receptor domain-containing protein n=1 Tax=Nostoc sp. TaxID=1180 RepID=UPI002FF68AF4